MADGADWLDVTLGNISSSGFMVKSANVLHLGQSVTIRRRGISISGKVVRVERTRYGVHSVEEIDVASLLATGDLQRPQALEPPAAKKRLWHWRTR
jgi:hypothetical protein